MSSSREVICPACGESITVAYYFEKGYPAHWSDWDGGYPGEPDQVMIDMDEVVCPSCGHYANEKEITDMEDRILEQEYDDEPAPPYDY